MTTPDYAEYQTKPSDKLFAKLNELAQQQTELESETARLEVELIKTKAKLFEVSNTKLPELMDELSLTEFSTTSGLRITVEEKIRASISDKNADAAFKWLEDNGQSGLIKRQFVVEFGRNEESWAGEFETSLRANPRQLNVKRKKAVHASTLKKFVKDQLEDGMDIPEELFGVFRQRVAKTVR